MFHAVCSFRKFNLTDDEFDDWFKHLHLDLQVVYGALKRPIAPAIGFFSQFVIMPMLAYSIASVVLADERLQPFALGLFITGCSPGGGGSNFITIFLRGNANFNDAFVDEIVGHKFMASHLKGTEIQVPHAKIIASLLTIIIPLFVGLLIARYKKNWADKAEKCLRPFVIFTVFLIILFTSIDNYQVVALVNRQILAAGCLLPWCGFLLGFLTALVLQQAIEDVIAIAIETAVQSSLVAIMVLKMSFPTQEADMGTLMALIVGSFTPGPVAVCYIVQIIARRYKKKRVDVENLNKSPPLIGPSNSA
uniref:Uncharacterized protein n=1 Tax=Ditylenchus dipsaci TaxID=166011 RepID=A0A915EP09_9BILA